MAAKSKHKHIYDKQCIVIRHFADIIMAERYTYCSICGNIGNNIIDGSHAIITGIEGDTLTPYLEKYSNLPQYHTNKYRIKNVSDCKFD